VENQCSFLKLQSLHSCIEAQAFGAGGESVLRAKKTCFCPQGDIGFEAGEDPNHINILGAHHQLLTEFGGYSPGGKTPCPGSRPTRKGRCPVSHIYLE